MEPYYERDGIVIYHGDCREILPTLDAESIDLVLADPPYGIGYVHGDEAAKSYASKVNQTPVYGDDEPFDPAPLLRFQRLILWGANHYASRLPDAAGWLVWDKRCNTGQNDQSDCELAWTNVLTTARTFYHLWNGFLRDSERGWRVHPTQKPVALMRWCLELVPDAAVALDPFMGSGTTLRAAKDLGRKAIGIEIEERYCEIAAKRLSQEVMAL
jgi:site-specific DNA-methyltransferase (adenine-specific)